MRHPDLELLLQTGPHPLVSTAPAPLILPLAAPGSTLQHSDPSLSRSPDAGAALAIVRLPRPPPLWGDEGQGPALRVTKVELEPVM